MRGPAGATPLDERGEIEVIHVDLEARGNVIPDQREPLSLLFGESPAVSLLPSKPGLEPLFDNVSERSEDLIPMKCEPHERDDVGQEPDTRCSSHLIAIERFV